MLDKDKMIDIGNHNLIPKKVFDAAIKIIVGKPVTYNGETVGAVTGVSTIRTRHTLQENIIDILNLCRQPRTKHFIKDKFNFSNDKLKRVLEDLQGQGFIIICLVSGDGRGTQAIQTTEVGKAYLLTKGVKY